MTTDHDGPARTPQGPAGPGVYKVVDTQNFPADSDEEYDVSCNSPNDLAISGGDVPVGLSYNSVAAEYDEYATEWSGPASNSGWDFFFHNGSPESIDMEFVVFCQPG